jgi:AraC-like DNA-binding protein
MPAALLAPAPDAAPAMLRVEAIRPLLAMMAASGLTPDPILRRAGLPADLLDQREGAMVRLSDYFRICEQMALQGNDESCHVSLRPLMVGTSELVQSRLRGCTSMAGVMEVLANSYNIIHGNRYNQIQRRGSTITYAIDDTNFPYAFDHDDAFIILSLECLLIYVHVLLLSLVPGEQSLPLRLIRTRGTADPAKASHLDFWKVPIRRGSPIFALEYDGAVDALGVAPASSPVLAARTIYGGVADMLDRIAPPTRGPAAIIERVEREIAAGRQDQAEVAAALGMSVASLRRRLADAGLPFRDVRANMLNSIACAALDDGQPIADIAEMLGFSDGRSFARAFRQWNGVAPGAWRQIAD